MLPRLKQLLGLLKQCLQIVTKEALDEKQNSGWDLLAAAVVPGCACSRRKGIVCIQLGPAIYSGELPSRGRALDTDGKGNCRLLVSDDWGLMDL